MVMFASLLNIRIYFLWVGVLDFHDGVLGKV
jgi:hypothetical protein